MSWMKRRTPSATPSPGLQATPPPVQMYNPNQHSNTAQDWQQQQPNNWYNQASVQSVPTMPTVNEQNSQLLQPNTYWQQSQQYQPHQQPQQQQQQYQPHQQPQQQQQQQHQQYQYGNNTLQSQQNNYYQPPLSQTTQQTAPGYEYNNMQYGYQSNMQAYQPTATVAGGHYDQNSLQQQPQQQQQPSDGWNNAWGWGDEDNSNSANVNNAHNANTNDESWNWNVEDNATAVQKPSEAKPEELFPKMGNKALQKPENLETVPLLPTLPANRRIKAEALTPQWSIESQVSQESSDDILQTSESDKLFSRSSTISHSPVSGHQTPLEAPAAVAKLEPQFEPCENKEIISNIKEEEKDVKPPPMLPPSLSPASGSTSGENPFKRNSKRTPPPADVKGFYMPTMSQSVNLETVPDNSEHPQPEVPSVENNEVAPLNERNQYLETGQLSDENDALPPPGLSRMVLGQFGQGEANEPPPGLSRMVLGQTEGAQSTASPPVGLHRMVPGESSSPEVRYEEEEVSDPELRLLAPIGRNPIESRSATIGADTPPAPPTNGTAPVEREMDLDGANTQDATSTIDVDTLASSVRDLTVGENTSDGREKSTAESSRRLDTDSEVERASSPSPHERKERRHKDDGGRRDKRYSPDYSRDGRLTRDGRDSRDMREKSRTSDRRRQQRDRGFDDDTDYYSDRERDRRKDEQRQRDDGDKKYSSLRRGERERDKDRRKRDGRDGRDVRDGRDSERRVEYGNRVRDRDYYYNRYHDDYDDSHRSSRPSSRSDSMHDSYYRNSRVSDRDRARDRDRERDRRHRDPYNMYKMPGYPYDAYNPYYQQYQYYLENLRRTDPAAYAELYRKYYGQSGAASSTYTQEEKTSVHSGRSSTNDDLAKERYLRQSYYGHASYPQMGAYYREQPTVSSAHTYAMDESSRTFEYTDSSMLLEDTAASQRLTPAKFSTAHAKASISSGRLVRVLPHYPMDGQSAVVELERVQGLLAADEERVELERFPGPLIRGITHKKTIIEYCNNKIRDRSLRADINDPDSYVLMWELLILLIRQNGMVVGADIAELLMKDRNVDSIIPRPSSVASNGSGVQHVEASDGIPEGVESTSNGAALKEEVVTRKFREYLLYGSVQQALEWAMKNSLWGHALFLASKLDKRTYAKVMTRFANGLPMNDPLQTLYQLLSGHLPAAVTSVSDEKWGDWRPHLAMILSNTMQRPELDRKAITTLGDTLMGRGSLYAAQFCYLMAEVGFSRYGQDGKLVLLGANHNKPFLQFAHNEAIHMTEIYEYACSLNDPAFKIPEFQAYKYLLATRLADRGFLETALAYAEQVSIALVANPTLAQPSLITKVCDLAERLKYYDPADYQDLDEAQMQAGAERPDQPWLQSLRTIQQQYTMGLISHESVNNLNALTPDTTGVQAPQSYDQSPQDPWTAQAQYVDNQYNQQQVVNNWQQSSVENDYNQQQPLPQEATSLDSYNAYQEQSWNTSAAQSTPQWSPDTQQSPMEAQTPQVDQLNPQVNDYWNNAQIEPAESRSKESVSNTARSVLRKRLNLRACKSTSLSRRSSSASSECESPAAARSRCGLFTRSAEKSQLICYKDDNRVITKLTKYNTFDSGKDKASKGGGGNERAKTPTPVSAGKRRAAMLTRFQSLDEPPAAPASKVIYYDTKSNVSISAQDFSADFCMLKSERKKTAAAAVTRHRHDVIADTVDAWAKKKNMLSNLKSCIFKQTDKDVVYKPLVFGGTFPIDAPTVQPPPPRINLPPDDARPPPDSPSPPEEPQRPQISMPNQSRQQRTSVSEDTQHSGGATAGDDVQKKAKGAEKKVAAAAGTGWFGGIWSKLALRPKNQMKLPDDKNPTIVWDQEKKSWINLDEDNADAAAELKPPPKMSDMMRGPEPQSLPAMSTNYGGAPQMPSQPTHQPQSLDAMPPSDAKPPLPTQNIFKMQRGRNLKKSYVDVFNPSGKPQSAGSSADFTAPTMPTASAAPMNFFVPAPVDPNAPVDFLTPSGMSHADGSGQSHQS